MNPPFLKSIKGSVSYSKIDVAKIRIAIVLYCRNVLELLRNADKPSLLKSTAIVVGFYAIIFGYIYIHSDDILKSIEDSMPSETVELSHGRAFGQEKTSHIANKNTNLVSGLFQFEEVGNIPIIRKSDQLTSFRAYQASFNFNAYENRNLLAFMVTDYGLSEKTSNMALDILPPQVSFLLSPYANLPEEWIKRARAKGHEVWIDLPIQSQTAVDQGLNTIFHHQSLSEKAKTMHKTLARALGYVGIGMFMDNSGLSINDHYKLLSNELYNRGLGIFEKNPNAPEYIEAIAIAKGAPFTKADLEVVQMKGKQSFQKMEAIAKKQGSAVAVVPSYPKAIKNLAVWLEKAGNVDYVVAPVSAIYDLPLERNSPPNKNNASTSGLKPSDHIAQPVTTHKTTTSHH